MHRACTLHNGQDALRLAGFAIFAALGQLLSWCGAEDKCCIGCVRRCIMVQTYGGMDGTVSSELEARVVVPEVPVALLTNA